MATPIIQSVGGTSGPGIAGQGRNDLVAGEQVTLSDAEPLNSGATYFWEIEDAPIGTAPTMINHTTATPHFFVDADAAKAGTYRVKATVNGAESSVEALAKPLANTGGRIPSYQETLQYDGAGNAKGWHEAQTVFQRAVDAELGELGPGAPGDILTQLVWAGGRESHNSDTPLIAGAFALNPNNYSLERTTVAFQFVIIAANGDTPLTTHVELFNLTDSEVVTSSQIDIIDSTTPTKYSATLVVGAGAGTIKNTGERLYECRIYLDVPPGGPSETIELFKAEVRVVFTVT